MEQNQFIPNENQITPNKNQKIPNKNQEIHEKHFRRDQIIINEMSKVFLTALGMWKLEHNNGLQQPTPYTAPPFESPPYSGTSWYPDNYTPIREGGIPYMQPLGPEVSKYPESQVNPWQQYMTPSQPAANPWQQYMSPSVPAVPGGQQQTWYQPAVYGSQPQPIAPNQFSPLPNVYNQPQSPMNYPFMQYGYGKRSRRESSLVDED